MDIIERLKQEWRELDFYYDCDNRLAVNQWRFYGSKKGLHNFVRLLREYANDKTNDVIGEHVHLGPYMSLTFVTSDTVEIVSGYFNRTLKDFSALSDAIETKLDDSQPGDSFTFHDDFGANTEMTAKVFVMAENFDPVSMDELIVSDRQKAVNAYLGRK